MPKILTTLTLDGVRDLIQHKRHETQHIAMTFGNSPQLEAKLNAYEYCLSLINRVKQ